MAADAREAMIVQIAIDVVAEDGFDISVRDLAKRIGVAHSILFRHFPSKAALTKRIYDDIFMSRLRTEWPALLMDDTVPLADRLLSFYHAYTDAIFDVAWVRIFLFAGLKGTTLNADYFAVLKAQVLEPICAAVRRHDGRKAQGGATAEEMEQAWGLHGRIFYIAIRQHVYRRPVPASLNALLRTAIAAFLDEAGRTKTWAAPQPSAVPAPARVFTPPRRMSPTTRARSIVEGAVPFFARYGISGQMRELASHLGITHSLLFHYFPRKQDLIDQVYSDVFERPWRSLEPLSPLDWHQLGDRLVAFYKAYFEIVDRDEWIRIFISAGLHDSGLCGRYLDAVEHHVIDVVAEAARQAIDAPAGYDLREDAWGLHGQIIYTAIRNHIYKMPSAISQHATVESAVAMFLASLDVQRRRVRAGVSLLRVAQQDEAEQDEADAEDERDKAGSHPNRRSLSEARKEDAQEESIIEDCT